ncbi:MAG: putative membrane protein [Alteromonadaceae bacterium]|jgi:putative membrane protein
MKDVDEKFQQQILFDEIDTQGKSANLPVTEQQVIFDNQDWLPEHDEPVVEDELIVSSSKPRWLWRIILSLFSVLILFETVTFFISGFSQSPIIASIYGIILFCLTLVFGTKVVREISSLRQFKKQQNLRSKVDDILANDLVCDARKLCQKITDQLPSDLNVENEQQWQQIAQSEYSDAEILQLYSRQVLSKVDEKALAEVAKFSTESVVLIALSPIAIVDMLLMFWRNLRMIDKIAGLYGLKLGYWSRIRLIKQVFVNMAYAGASEIIADFGTDLIGADLLGKLSSRMAQGFGAGMLTARLGIKTIKLCRPIPFYENEPKLNSVRKQILSQLKLLLKK